jgi:hypothetical protein
MSYFPIDLKTFEMIAWSKNCVQQWHTPPHQGHMVVAKAEGVAMVLEGYVHISYQVPTSY